MNIIKDAFINAILADATYALEDNGFEGLKDGALRNELTSRMTEPLAQYIADNFVVVTNINTSDSMLGTSV